MHYAELNAEPKDEIYSLVIHSCLRVHLFFQECGHKAVFYHGSMDPAQRAFVQKQWSKDEINIICATVAFGMGTINCCCLLPFD